MQIPLFPLHTVLCPGIALPLHVFEPRYRLMVERLLSAGNAFGVVLIREGREVGGESVSIAGVGTLAEIRQASRHPDGRYDLLVVGAARFAIETVDPEREPYIMAEVSPLEEEVGDPERVERIASRVMRRFVDYLRLLQPMDGESAEEIDIRVEVEVEDDGGASEADPEGSEPARGLRIPDDPAVLSHLLSGIIQVEPLQRQVLLEADSAEERLAGLDALLRRELWFLRRRLRLYTPERPEPTLPHN